jgi:hypothetical protein
MKLLRDFIRLRAAGRVLLGRRAASRRTWTITVPAPLNKSSRSPVTLAVSHGRERVAIRRQEAAAAKGLGHLRLVSQR